MSESLTDELRRLGYKHDLSKIRALEQRIAELEAISGQLADDRDKACAEIDELKAQLKEKEDD